MWNLFVLFYLQHGFVGKPHFYELKTAFSETEDYFQWLIIAQYSMLNLHFWSVVETDPLFLFSYKK